MQGEIYILQDKVLGEFRGEQAHSMAKFVKASWAFTT